MPTDTKAGLELVAADPNAVYIMDSSVLEFYVNKQCQTFVTATESFDLTGFALVVSKGAPYQAHISH